MKFGTLLSSVFVLFAAAAFAQSADSQLASDLSTSVVAARCRYAPADEICATLRESSPAQHMDDATVAQVPRRVPGPPMRRPMMRRPRPAYPAMWRPEVSGRHALIGALIGGSIGTLIAIKGNAGARAGVALGALGAGIGAGMGLSIPSFPSGNPYWRGRPGRRWPDRGSPDDDESASGMKPEPAKPDASQAALRSAPPQSPAGGETRAPSADVP
ncbi:MAG: hypothetical protein ACLQBK_23020 [Candidatus Sulfotelmatobacter sp.]